MGYCGLTGAATRAVAAGAVAGDVVADLILEAKMDRKAHWENVYGSKAEAEVSWYQPDPELSMKLILEVCPPQGKVIDVGGGASLLVDRLLAEGFVQPAVLDISGTALAKAKQRLGAKAQRVRWLVADVTETTDIGHFDVWHDRAVFHFLTTPEERRGYVRLASKSLIRGGHLILATFALDGPARCSNLEVCRYDAKSALAELGSAFEIMKDLRETHLTPNGKTQQFFYGMFRRV